MLRSNRDLYAFVSRIIKEHRDQAPSLQAYLLSLWKLAHPYESRDHLPLDEFARLLEQALVVPPPPLEPSWHEASFAVPGDGQGFCLFEKTIITQILDLQQLQEEDRLDDEYRYFGMDVRRRGPRPGKTPTLWYNFDTLTFLECGIQGTFGGPTAEEDTGRVLVPGPVAVLDTEGQVRSVRPQDIVEPVEEMERIGWDRVVSFLEHGQSYE